ncbi:MAG: aldose epimerase family protein [Candidatus Latescibacterota bacterium]
MVIKRQVFGVMPDGRMVDLYTLVNSHGLEARIANYGGTVVSLFAPDREGKWADIVLGRENLEGYFPNNPYFGCIVGRYGNRIAGGKFVLNGVEHTLARNNGPNHLHGGVKGFNQALWDAETFLSETGPSLKLSYLSPDGEEGYPGNLSVTVTYTVTDANELRIDYEAAADRPTVVNLTHHSYFNLAGAEAGNILGHELTINADAFTPIDETLITTGEIRSVKGTPLDFTEPAVIGARIGEDYDQLVFGLGYDHNWVLNKAGSELSFAARVREPASGRVMEVYTTEPGIQFYSGNFLDGSITGKKGKVYHKRDGLCLETQHFPDSVNKPRFPSTVLNPGERYTQTTIYRFEAEG